MKCIYLVVRHGNYEDQSETVLEAWSTKDQAQDRANFFRETICDVMSSI